MRVSRGSMRISHGRHGVDAARAGNVSRPLLSARQLLSLAAVYGPPSLPPLEHAKQFFPFAQAKIMGSNSPTQTAMPPRISISRWSGACLRRVRKELLSAQTLHHAAVEGTCTVE